jgi:hypothetical protein
MFSRLKKPISEAFGRTGLHGPPGQENVFPNEDLATAARQRYALAAVFTEIRGPHYQWASSTPLSRFYCFAAARAIASALHPLYKCAQCHARHALRCRHPLRVRRQSEREIARVQHGDWAASLLAQPIFFQLAPQRHTVDPQHARRLGSVSISQFQHMADMLGFL